MTTNEEYVQGLRDMADFLEAHPSLINGSCEFNNYCFAYDMETFSALCRALGKSEKVDDGSYLELRRSFGPHSVGVNIAKEQSCEKVQVGTTRKIVSIPAEAVRSEKGDYWEVEEPVYEWVCPPVWLGAS